MTGGEDLKDAIRRRLKYGLPLYVFAVLLTTAIFNTSDEARPPYLGWKGELGAALFVVTFLFILAYWEWFR